MQKLGDRFASKVLSSSLLMALSFSRDAGICTSVLIVSVLTSLEVELRVAWVKHKPNGQEKRRSRKRKENQSRLF
jgi:hypothetical protein